MTQAERIAALEVEVKHAHSELKEVKSLVVEQNDKIDKQCEDIKELTAALNQGRGVIAGISFLLGTSFLGVISYFQGWFK